MGNALEVFPDASSTESHHALPQPIEDALPSKLAECALEDGSVLADDVEPDPIPCRKLYPATPALYIRDIPLGGLDYSGNGSRDDP